MLQSFAQFQCLCSSTAPVSLIWTILFHCNMLFVTKRRHHFCE